MHLRLTICFGLILSTKKKQTKKTITFSFRLRRGKPQAYHPLFVSCAAQLLWPYRLITLALLKSKFRAVKTEENIMKTLKITAILFKFVFLCLFWRVASRERYFRNNGWTRSKVEKREPILKHAGDSNNSCWIQ